MGKSFRGRGAIPIRERLVTGRQADRKSFRDWAQFESAIPVEHAPERLWWKAVDEALQFDRNAPLGNVDRASLGGANDVTVEVFFVVALFRPQQLPYRGVKTLHAPFNRRIVGERAEPVVEQEWRRRPDADQ